MMATSKVILITKGTERPQFFQDDPFGHVGIIYHPPFSKSPTQFQGYDGRSVAYFISTSGDNVQVIVHGYAICDGPIPKFSMRNGQRIFDVDIIEDSNSKKGIEKVLKAEHPEIRGVGFWKSNTRRDLSDIPTVDLLEIKLEIERES